jgi:chromate transporter
VADEAPIVKGSTAILLTLAMQLSLMSLLTFGGGINTVVPELQRQVVDVHRWMDARTFADLFAIAQASPGPNMLIVTLVGLKAAGLAGAAVTTIAVCAPTCTLTFYVSRVWDRIRNSPWRAVVQGGVAPAAVGLIFASAFLIARGADHAPSLVAITAATALFTYFTRFNPLWALGVAAGLGLVGWIG